MTSGLERNLGADHLTAWQRSAKQELTLDAGALATLVAAEPQLQQKLVALCGPWLHRKFLTNSLTFLPMEEKALLAALTRLGIDTKPLTRRVAPISLSVPERVMQRMPPKAPPRAKPPKAPAPAAADTVKPEMAALLRYANANRNLLGNFLRYSGRILPAQRNIIAHRLVGANLLSSVKAFPFLLGDRMEWTAPRMTILLKVVEMQATDLHAALKAYAANR